MNITVAKRFMQFNESTFCEISFPANLILATNSMLSDVINPKPLISGSDWSLSNCSLRHNSKHGARFTELTKSTPSVERIEDVVYLAVNRRNFFPIGSFDLLLKGCDWELYGVDILGDYSFAAAYLSRRFLAYSKSSLSRSCRFCSHSHIRNI